MKKKTLIIILSIIILIVVILCGALIWYSAQLKPVDKNDYTERTVEIQSGMSTDEILNLLKENRIIKNTFASKVYIKLNDIKGLQAGKYTLNSTMELKDVLEQISSGKIMDETVTITFLEGKNMRWIAGKIAEQTNNTEEQVYRALEDEEYINSLKEKYWFLTDEIQNDDIYYPLEGYLYPETYKFENADVTVQEIFEVLLNQTDIVLSEYKSQIEESGLNVHQIITLASIVELEGNSKESREKVSSVIYNRLKSNMSIGSDVTTYYGIQVDVGERNLYASEINTYNAYNTRGPNMNGKLPVGPIASVSKESIEAALNPANTDYLYFVSDINGNIHFTSTYTEHQQLVQELRNQGLWYEYK